MPNIHMKNAYCLFSVAWTIDYIALTDSAQEMGMPAHFKGHPSSCPDDDLNGCVFTQEVQDARNLHMQVSMAINL